MIILLNFGKRRKLKKFLKKQMGHLLFGLRRKDNELGKAFEASVLSFSGIPQWESETEEEFKKRAENFGLNLDTKAQKK